MTYEGENKRKWSVNKEVSISDKVSFPPKSGIDMEEYGKFDLTSLECMCRTACPYTLRRKSSLSSFFLYYLALITRKTLSMPRPAVTIRRGIP